MKNASRSATALFIWVVTLFVLYPHAVNAQQAIQLQLDGSLAHDLRTYDLESLAWAVIMSLMGGGLRTIFTLATDKTVVLSFGREMLKDMVVAMIAGALAFIGLEAVAAAKWVAVPPELRFAAIVFAGWSRLSFFGWINTLGMKITEAAERKITGSVGPGEEPRPLDVPETPGEKPPPTPAKPKPKPFQEAP